MFSPRISSLHRRARAMSQVGGDKLGHLLPSEEFLADDKHEVNLKMVSARTMFLIIIATRRLHKLVYLSIFLLCVHYLVEEDEVRRMYSIEVSSTLLTGCTGPGG
jgi:hypothetical protein